MCVSTGDVWGQLLIQWGCVEMGKQLRKPQQHCVCSETATQWLNVNDSRCEQFKSEQPDFQSKFGVLSYLFDPT